MIYVIAETRLVSGITTEDIKAGKCEVELCIKIGFTTNLNNRLNMYMTDTPRFDVLYTYEEGTDEDEKRLHKYFEKFQPGDLNGREWFIWNEEIIKFFETNTTIDQMREALDQANIRLSTRMENERQREFIGQITPIINLIIELDTLGWKMTDPFDYQDQFEELSHYFCQLGSTSDIFKLIEASGVSEDKISQLVKGYNEYLTSGKEEIDKFNSIAYYHHKMKYVCDLGEYLPKDKFILFLNSIPKSFKNYYTVLGPEVCKAKKYQKGEMEKEYQRRLNNQGISLDDRIYEAFRAGTRLSLTQIITQLQKVYEDAGYVATARAIDINNWFRTKPIKITDKELGKRVNGFELISRTKK